MSRVSRANATETYLHVLHPNLVFVYRLRWPLRLFFGEGDFDWAFSDSASLVGIFVFEVGAPKERKILRG